VIERLIKSLQQQLPVSAQELLKKVRGVRIEPKIAQGDVIIINN
jgi:hypothetical protein